jgi:amidase
MSDIPSTEPTEERTLDRKKLLQIGAAAAATPAVAGVLAERARADGRRRFPARDLEEITIAELQEAMEDGELTARRLVRMYLRRIDAIDFHGPKLNSVIELNPDALEIARELDRERRNGNVLGPLHGIPVLLKDNIDTGDKMQTTAGSLGLVGAPASQDSTVAAKLREAGAVILGKTNLSEWANFRSQHSSSGWSGRDGQTRNAYVLDRNPCGSSSGSGVAPSANLTAVSIGTETDGSIVCPASINAVVGIKPTVGLVSRAGVVPISASQDTVGPYGRTVADAAAVLGAIASKTPDTRDPATNGNRDKVFTDYLQFVDPNGLRGARIGVARAGVSGYSEETDRVFDAAVAAIRAAGADVVDPVDIPTINQINAGAEEITVLIFEFKRDLNAYLATRTGVPITSLASAIQFNLDHADQELKWFLQEWFDIAEARLDIVSGDGSVITDEEYNAAREAARNLGGRDGIDAALASVTPKLDALIAPTASPSWPIDLVNGDHFLGASSSPAAIAGYPLIAVPAGDAFGLPVGITFMGTAYSEPTLIKLASGFENATKARKKPEFLPTLPFDDPPQRLRTTHALRRTRKTETQLERPARPLMI